MTIELQFDCFYLCPSRWRIHKGLSAFRVLPLSCFARRAVFRFRIGARAVRSLKWIYIVMVWALRHVVSDEEVSFEDSLFLAQEHTRINPCLKISALPNIVHRTSSSNPERSNNGVLDMIKCTTVKENVVYSLIKETWCE